MVTLPFKSNPATNVPTPVTLRFCVTASVISVLVIVAIPTILSPFIFAFASVTNRC